MRPIPRAMLTHTAALLQPSGEGGDAGLLAPVATLTRVYVEQRAEETLTAEDTRLGRAALLLYDARHSRPRDVAFATGQRVLVQGVLYRVAAVEPLMDGPRLHHVELTLAQ